MTERLLASPHAFDLFQALSLLERATPWATPIGYGSGVGEAVRLRAHVSMAFQPSDVFRVLRETPPGAGVGAPADIDRQSDRNIDRPRYTVTTGALSLAGANGPLPLFITEALLWNQAAQRPAMGDFLDVFNHRLLSLLYRARKKHAMGLNAARPWSSPQMQCAAALCNIDVRSAVSGTDGPWLRHAGLLGSRTRSMSGLLTMVGDRLGLPLRGEQFRGRWRRLESHQRMTLSAGAQPRVAVDGTRALGGRHWDLSAGVDIRFPSLAVDRLERLLPDGPDHALVQALLKSYARRELAVALVLPAPSRASARPIGGRAPEAPGASATATAPRLGWTSWLALPGRPLRPGTLRVEVNTERDRRSRH